MERLATQIFQRLLFRDEYLLDPFKCFQILVGSIKTGMFFFFPPYRYSFKKSNRSPLHHFFSSHLFILIFLLFVCLLYNCPPPQTQSIPPRLLHFSIYLVRIDFSVFLFGFFHSSILSFLYQYVSTFLMSFILVEASTLST